MALVCSECGHKVELSDADRRRLAGKFLACPECGVSRKLPPAADVSQTNAGRMSRRSWLPALAATLPLAGLSLWYWSSKIHSKSSGKDKAKEVAVAAKPSVAPGFFSKDKHLDEVRAWLRENTNSGQWEEVRWWPVRDVKTPSGIVVRVGRLKYRTSNALGKRLNDDVFVFHDDGRLNWSHSTRTSRTDSRFTSETVNAIVEAIDAEDERTK